MELKNQLEKTSHELDLVEKAEIGLQTKIKNLTQQNLDLNKANEDNEANLAHNSEL